MEERKRIAIFASGNGTNCENIIRYFQAKGDAEIAFVLSNKADAYALVRARRLGVKTVVMTRDTFNDESAVMELMRREHVGFIVLAGFLLLVPPFLIDAFDHRMVNIHPALLPKYGGKGMYGRHVHEAVKAAGESETGMTVHWVTREYDSGAIIAQYKTAISPTDTVDDIAAKEHELEMKYFPEVIDRIISGL
ncbi:MAG: phosphoribosylglycinamide formyltransferase [Prevotella sp.]|uniref:phosphoribosylglycinamide formyltransferase n=1 Tax=Prevotella sp. TaxID=59823 RepID=UPI00258F1BA3|nr:phosphoribosylglycinamide formyltransferase [Prevotella sp.]MDD6853559.1 phosphoribosylglycinamide formyltransferase [Prevotella sp.]